VARAKKDETPKKEGAEATPKGDEGKKKAEPRKKSEKEEPPKKEEPKKEEPKKEEPKKEEPKKEERKKSEKAAEAPAKETAKGGGGKKKGEAKPAEVKPEPAKEAPAAAAAAETKEEHVVVHQATPAAGKPLTILAISGSLRKGSYNTGLIHAAQKMCPAGVEMVLYDISRLPMFNQDTESLPHEEVKKFKDAITAADAIFFACPEYNYSISGALKNAIDIASRPYGQNVWTNKPCGLVSAAYGIAGGIRAQQTLRQSFVFLKLIPYPGPDFPEFAVGAAHEKCDQNGVLTDEKTRQHLQGYVSGFVAWLHHHSRR